jgi:DNA gyrase subunit A
MWVQPSTGKDDIILVSQKGQAVRFKEDDVRAMGRTAAGVRGIKLKESDAITGMGIIREGSGKANQICVIMEKGYGKRTALSQYKVQGRGGSGIKTANISSKTGAIVSAFIVTPEDVEKDIVIISGKGQVIRLPLKSVNNLGRATQGVRLMRFKAAGDTVASVTKV